MGFKITTYAELTSQYDSHANAEITYATDRDTFYFRAEDTLREFPIPLYSQANIDILNNVLATETIVNSVIIDEDDDITEAIDAAIVSFGAGSATNRIQILLKPGTGYTAPFTVDGTNRGWGIRLGGSDNGGDYISVRPMHGLQPSDVVITATGTSVTGGTPSPCMIDSTGHCEISGVTLVCSTLQADTSVVARFIHWDLGGTDNYGVFRGLRFRSTTGCAGLSTGIGAGQTLIIEDCHMEGGGNIVGVHGKNTSTGTGPAVFIVKNCTSNGKVYDNGSTKQYTGINIDGQITLPDHDLVAIVANCHFPRPSNQSAGDRGLNIAHPPAGGDTIRIQSTTTGTSQTITTWARHGFVVGQTITIINCSGNSAGCNGTWVVASTPTEYTFTATGTVSSGAGGAVGSITTASPTIKWTYVIDRSVQVDFSGIVGNHAWNCIQWPVGRMWPQKNGPTFTEGYVGAYLTSDDAAYVAAGASDPYPFVAAQVIDTPVANRKVYPNVGPYAHVNIASTEVVAVGDLIVSSAVNGNGFVDNAATDPAKILGIALSTKTATTGAGRVMIKTLPVPIMFWAN